MVENINLTEPSFDETELELVRACLDSKWVTQGPMTERFGAVHKLKGYVLTIKKSEKGLLLWADRRLTMEDLRVEAGYLAYDPDRIDSVLNIVAEPGPFRTEFLGRSISAGRIELPVYAETAGKMRRTQKSNDGNQAGDPGKAVAVILKAVYADEPPLHLPLGEAAYAGARAKFAAFAKTMDTWEADAKATGF